MALRRTQRVLIAGLTVLFSGSALPGTSATITNLGKAATEPFALPLTMPVDSVGADHVLFRVSEADEGADLNGDGDQSDQVLHVHQFSTSTTINAGVAAWATLSGTTIVASFSEADRAVPTDLNGDGDSSDFVLAVHDAVTGVTTNVGLESYFGILDGSLLYFLVSEAGQGFTDLNGDGDTFDNVAFVLDVQALSLTNLQLAAAGSIVGPIARVWDGIVGFHVSETDQGGADLNGDGDLFDSIVVIYEQATGTLTTLPRAVEWTSDVLIDGAVVAITVDEAADGARDWNGDSDAQDIVVWFYDTSSDTFANTALAGGTFEDIGEGYLALSVPEWMQGNIDLNGDGDSTDVVAHLVRFQPPQSFNLGLATSGPQEIDAGRLHSMVSETQHGGTDLNGDGDSLDTISFLTDLSSLATTNIGRAGGPLLGETLLFRVDESDVGINLNGDSDFNDVVLHLYDIPSGRDRNLGLVVQSTLQRRGDLLGLAVVEQALDLNGDGDTSDVVLSVFDITNGVAVNTDLATVDFFLGPDRLLLRVSEADQGGADLNGDTDTGDSVAHVATLATDQCGSIESYGSACAPPFWPLPELLMTGCPQVGDGLVVSVVGAPYFNALVLLVAGSQRATTPFGAGCVLNVQPVSQLFGPFALSGSGTLVIPTSVPPGTPATAVTLQALISWNGQHTATNGIEMNTRP